MPDDAACRRLAAQLAAQLPESKANALKTIEYLRQLAEGYLYPTEDKSHDVGNVVRLGPRFATD